MLGSTTRVQPLVLVLSARRHQPVRRLGWSGTIPTTLMLQSERPKVSQAKRRPIFIGEQLEQTIAAAREPFRTLFTVAALTGARVSELCGLTWADVRVEDTDDAEIEFGWQVDRHDHRAPTKTDGSARTVPIPRDLALVLVRHKRNARSLAADSFVFATGTGRPVQQRNVARTLREAQRRAVDGEGRPAFPVLHEVNDAGQPVAVPRRTLPSMHSFRHTVASRALLAGESVDEIAFLLGHRDGTVTRTVYVREVADARRRSMRRSRMTAEFGAALAVALDPKRDPTSYPSDALAARRVALRFMQRVAAGAGREPPLPPEGVQQPGAVDDRVVLRVARERW
ncbi:MAG: site-specific integrase [Actinomycetota bacterium]|nr:site-specific integrase [Actinomycetota bacterium]